MAMSMTITHSVSNNQAALAAAPVNGHKPVSPLGGGTSASSSASQGGSAVGAVFGPDPYGTPEGLTAEGLLLYLQTRLNGLDEQINGIFKKQQAIEKARQALSAIQNELSGLKDDAGDKALHGAGGDKGQPVNEAAIMQQIEALREVDPALADQITNDLNAEGQILYCDEKYFTSEVNNTREYVNNVMKSLESSAQMEMIRLQSLMSARGTAIQLSTNLLASLHSPMQAIVSNCRV